MKRGKTEAETIRINGWKEGDIIEGTESQIYTSRLLITKIGEEAFLCREDRYCRGNFGKESGNWTLGWREWKKVGNINEGDQK